MKSSESPRKARRLVYVGSTRRRKHEPKPCDHGHVGPFVRAELYSAFPDSLWHGFADCMTCGSTVLLPADRRAS